MKQMIINSSELLPDDAMDDNGNPITKRTKLVNYYEELLCVHPQDKCNCTYYII